MNWPDTNFFTQFLNWGKLSRFYERYRYGNSGWFSNYDGKDEKEMSQICEICGKKPMTGCNVSHAHNVTKRRFNLNLQRVRIISNGRVKKADVCTTCIKSGSIIKAP